MAPPTSVILPTIRETEVVDQLADQLVDDDELLVVCDSAADPVARAVDLFPDGVRLVVAGEPAGCSGKANAIATAMAAARHDRIVWTDDDFYHPPDWLAALQADYDRQGPTTERPFFVGHDLLSTVLEPAYAMGATLGLGLVGVPWGGAVIFEREDLDETAFLSDLRRTVSDDGLLGAYLDVRPVDRVRRVGVGGTITESLERNTRFMQIVEFFSPYPTLTVPLAAFFFACCLLFPLPSMVVSTLGGAALYAAFGIRRWSFLLSYPALVVQFPLLLWGLNRQFVWGGRRYDWRGRFEVVVDG